MNICIRNKGLITGNIRNRGKKELSKWSNCSVLQGIKVGSAEEHNQYILIPQRVSQQVNTLSPSKATVSLKEVGYPPADLNIPQQYICTLNKHPRQSWPKDCSPAVYPTFSGITSPIQFKTSPRESNLVPQESWNHLPSSKLIPSRFGKLIPRRARTRLPALFKSYVPTRI